jgi:flagellin FlaB
MVLVAGIAASVLVQTANRLEIRAMITGEQTTGEVSTGLAVFDIEGHITNAAVDNMTISVRPRAGSKDIDLKETIIEISDGTTKVLLSYNESATWNFNASVSSFNGQVFSTYTLGWNMTNEEFGIIVLEDADGSCTAATPVINRGDSVMLCVNTSACFNGGFGTRDDVWGAVMPEEGVPGVFSFRVPASLSDTVYDLY